jgi:hypothetical protein
MQSRCLSEGILYTNRSLTFELYRLHSCCMKFAADSLPHAYRPFHRRIAKVRYARFSGYVGISNQHLPAAYEVFGGTGYNSGLQGLNC